MKKSFLKSAFSILIAPFLILSGCSGSQKHSSSDLSDKKVGYQLDAPKKDEEIAIVSTNLGQFKMRFFPEAAPKAVENFKVHSKNGYYNGLIFHRVINNFMIQTGDPSGNGTGGESIWHEPFEDEFTNKLFNITGSVSMANSGKNTNGSQIFINQGGKENFHGWDYYQTIYDKHKNNKSVSTIDMSKLTDDIKELYNNNGGNPHLDGALNTLNKGHTVFAQVFDGMDVINKIASVEVDSSDKPLKDVIIEKIEIVNFEG